MNSGQSAVKDNIPDELLETGGENIVQFYTELCSDVLEAGEWQEDWTTSIIIPP